MNHRLISQALAVLLLSAPMGWGFAEMNRSDIQKYRGLDHQALLAVLEDQLSGGLAFQYIMVVFTVAFIFLLVHTLAGFLDLLLTRLLSRSDNA